LLNSLRKEEGKHFQAFVDFLRSVGKNGEDRVEILGVKKVRMKEKEGKAGVGIAENVVHNPAYNQVGFVRIVQEGFKKIQ